MYVVILYVYLCMYECLSIYFTLYGLCLEQILANVDLCPKGIEENRDGLRHSQHSQQQMSDLQ